MSRKDKPNPPPTNSWEREFRLMVDQVFLIACAAQGMRLSRKMFLTICGSMYDRAGEWHARNDKP